MISTTKSKKVNSADKVAIEKANNLSMPLSGFRPDWMLLALAVIPPLFLLVALFNYAVNVPFYDDWHSVAQLLIAHSGKFSFFDLFAPYNGHIVVFPRFLTLLLMQTGGWNILSQIFASFAIVVLTLLVLWRLSVLTFQPRIAAPATLLISVLLFSTVQWENWLWGFQLCFFMINFFFILTLWIIARWPQQWWALGLAIATAFITNYCLATGFLIWPAVLLGMLICWKKWGWRFILAWASAGAISSGLFFWIISKEPGGSFSTAKQPLEAILYVFSLLGSPWVSWGEQSIAFGIPIGETSPNTVKAQIFAFIFVSIAFVALLSILVWNWRKSLKIGYKAWEKSLPWLQMAGFGLLSSAATVVGRGGHGPEHAFTDRYTTVSLIFWLGVIGAVLVSLPEFLAVINKPFRLITLTLSGLVAAALLGAFLISSVNGYQLMQRHSWQLQDSVLGLYNYKNASDEALRKVYPNPGVVRGYVAELEKYEPLFKTPVDEFSRNLDEKWRNQLSSSQYNRLTIRANELRLTFGEVQSFKAESDTVSFSSKAPGLSFYLTRNLLFEPRSKFDVQLYPKMLFILPQWDKQVLDVQAKKAEFVNVFWDTGKGLREAEKYTANPLDSADGWRHFRMVMPPNLVGLRIDLHYDRNPGQSDQLKVDVYTRK